MLTREKVYISIISYIYMYFEGFSTSQSKDDWPVNYPISLYPNQTWKHTKGSFKTPNNFLSWFEFFFYWLRVQASTYTRKTLNITLFIYSIVLIKMKVINKPVFLNLTCWELTSLKHVIIQVLFLNDQFSYNPSCLNIVQKSTKPYWYLNIHQFE